MWEYDYGYLAHHGIKGQKWGVRRYQNYDGSLTAAGKKHRENSDGKKSGLTSKQKKAIAGTALAAAGAASAYIYLKNNPNAMAGAELAVKLIGSKTVDALRPLSQKGEAYVKDKFTKEALSKPLKDFTSGFVQGAGNAPAKVGKAVGEGLALGATLSIVKKVMGEEEAEKIIKQYNSFNKKNKISLDPFKTFRTKNDGDEDEDE